MNTYKIIYESRLEDLERLKKEMSKQKAGTEKAETQVGEGEGEKKKGSRK